ncbi:hypothetical protein E2C01_055215 [Portunus trituberculatus]|uniref:Uncharacterized protein n=1 Tax=Portunus trituberculatus TaxID=210409 RepID=A0A5B7GLZ8_PORTR|nr:hypothetical protein [Portunus trituberculatus]
MCVSSNLPSLARSSLSTQLEQHEGCGSPTRLHGYRRTAAVAELGAPRPERELPVFPPRSRRATNFAKPAIQEIP